MLGRLGDAVKDAAETLRRAFHDPASSEVGLVLAARPGPDFAALGTPPCAGLAPLTAVPGNQRLAPEAPVFLAQVNFTALPRGESAWAAWSAGAKVEVMGTFAAGRSARLEVPSLPRRAVVRSLAGEAFPRQARRGFEPLARPAARAAAPAIAAPASRRGLELAFGLPLAVAGEDLRSAPRPVQMRCSLQIVKATGENVRNLDLLGRYTIPRKGVRELRHDAASGRLLLLLGPEAAGAERTTLLLARRKDDRSLLTCFAEDAP